LVYTPPNFAHEFSNVLVDFKLIFRGSRVNTTKSILALQIYPKAFKPHLAVFSGLPEFILLFQQLKE